MRATLGAILPSARFFDRFAEARRRAAPRRFAA